MFAIAQAERTGHAAQVKRDVSAARCQPRPVPPVSACRSSRRKCHCRGADNQRRDSLSWCLRPERLVQQTLCNVSLLLAAGIWREEKGGGGDKGPLVSLMERGEPNPQPPARRRGRAAVPHHTGALVPASERRVTGWHVSRGDAFMFLCVWEEMLTKRRNIRLFARPLIGSIQSNRTLMW